jgi:hypothetical protein
MTFSPSGVFGLHFYEKEGRKEERNEKSGALLLLAGHPSSSPDELIVRVDLVNPLLLVRRGASLVGQVTVYLASGGHIDLHGGVMSRKSGGRAGWLDVCTLCLAGGLWVAFPS